MKEFVKEMDEEIRKIMTGDRPELIEIRTQLILTVMANKLRKNNLISGAELIELHNEITDFYK